VLRRPEADMGDLVHIRDYKRREEQAAADARIADKIRAIGRADDTAPCEMPPVWPSYEAPESDPA
jgi:hypothetical protein